MGTVTVAVRSATAKLEFFFEDFTYLFLERREGEREGEKDQFASCTPPAGDLAHNPGMCPDWEFNL